MKTKSIKVYVNPLWDRSMEEMECLVLYEDDTFSMLFYNDYHFPELIIKNKNKTWYQWGFDDTPTKAINYLGCGKLAKYKKELIQQGFELMRKVEIIKEEKKNKHEEEYQEWLNTKYPTTEEELDFLFTNI